MNVGAIQQDRDLTTDQVETLRETIVLAVDQEGRVTDQVEEGCPIRDAEATPHPP